MIDEALAHILEVGLIGSVCVVLLCGLVKLYKDCKKEREAWAKSVNDERTKWEQLHREERDKWTENSLKAQEKFIQALENNTRALEGIRVNTQNMGK